MLASSVAVGVRSGEDLVGGHRWWSRARGGGRGPAWLLCVSASRVVRISCLLGMDFISYSSIQVAGEELGGRELGCGRREDGRSPSASPHDIIIVRYGLDII
jgi:hypothetical protein